MFRGFSNLMVILIVLAVVAPAARGRSAQAFRLGHNRFLFLDTFLLDKIHHAALCVNPPREAKLVLIADRPWEAGGITSYGNVFWDPIAREYRLYYVPVCWDVAPGFGLCLATSPDGICWKKPAWGVIEWKGTKANNLVIWGQREGTVLIDPKASTERRYAFLSSHPVLQTRLYTSPDGIHFKMHETVISPLHSDSQIASFWDADAREYFHYPRRVENGLRAIGFVRTRRMDQPWPDPREIPVVMSPDDRDPPELDLYTNAAQKYLRAPNTYLAFPTPYYHYNRPRARAHLVEPTLAKGGKTNDGTIETQLATSRDGRRWTRYRTPYVPLGIYEGLDIKVAMIIPGLVYDKQKLYQYCCAYTFTHGDTQVRHGRGGRSLGGIYRLEQRIDGFISLDFDYPGGEVITEPFVFQGKRLTLNVNTSASGEGRVAILDARGRPIPGYGLDQARYINGSYLAKTVQWKRGNDVSALAGRAIRLRFVMRGTKLYSFQFRD